MCLQLKGDGVDMLLFYQSVFEMCLSKSWHSVTQVKNNSIHITYKILYTLRRIMRCELCPGAQGPWRATCVQVSFMTYGLRFRPTVLLDMHN